MAKIVSALYEDPITGGAIRGRNGGKSLNASCPVG
jgi:hypothetical protein